MNWRTQTGLFHVHAAGTRTTLNHTPAAEPTIMNKPDRPHRWFPVWRSAPRSAADDPADYGTAFGLDLSLDDRQAEPAAPVVAKAQAGWVQRLSVRRRAAT